MSDAEHANNTGITNYIDVTDLPGTERIASDVHELYPQGVRILIFRPRHCPNSGALSLSRRYLRIAGAHFNRIFSVFCGSIFHRFLRILRMQGASKKNLFVYIRNLSTFLSSQFLFLVFISS